MFRWIVILIALFFSACDQGGTVESKISDARARNDGPAIWVAKGDDSTLYLFGTVHLLPDDLNWQRDDMKAAFDKSGTIFFEVDTNDAGQIEASVLARGLGFYNDGRRLSDQLDSYELKLLEAAANNGDLNLATLDSMKPWLAAEFLTVAAAAGSGLSPELAADEALKNRARRLRKNVIYLDTIESQIRMSAEQPDFVQMMVLTDTLESFNGMGNDTARVAQAWAVGQTEFLTTEIINASKSRSPDFYRSGSEYHLDAEL